MLIRHLPSLMNVAIEIDKFLKELKCSPEFRYIIFHIICPFKDKEVPIVTCIDAGHRKIVSQQVFDVCKNQ